MMTSTTRNRFDQFGPNAGVPNGDQSRAFQGTALGQNLTGSSSWNGGIWANTAIGSGLKGLNDASRSLAADTSALEKTEAVTGSGSLLPSSDADTWGRQKSTQWPSVSDMTSGLTNGRTSHTSTSPVRHRNSNQHTRSTSPYFSIAQPTAIGQGMTIKSTNQSYLDPTSGSFKAPTAFESHYQSNPARHNSDDASRRSLNSIVFGSSDTGYPSQPARSTSNASIGYPGYHSGVASRSGSIPPSRNGVDHASQICGDYSSLNAQSQFSLSEASSHRPALSNHTSTFSINGNQRYPGQIPPLQFGDLSTSLGKMDINKESLETSYSSYYELPQQVGNGSLNSISAMNSSAYRGNQAAFGLEGRQGTVSNQYRIQFGDHSAHSPNGNEVRRSHDSPSYAINGTPPIGEHHRAPSNTSSRGSVSNVQVAQLERKLRGLEQAQQQYPPPQINQIQFRTPYAQAYEYNPNMLRMNPLAQYYPLPAVGGYQTPRMIPRAPALDTVAGESLRSTLLEEFRSNNKGPKRYELKDIYDHVVEFSGDQHGSRFIQQKLETANSDEKDQIFREILPNSIQLMTDVFGNYVIQKFFEHGNQSQKKVLANQMKGHILELSQQMYGCRVVQKAFEHILTDQQASLVKELENNVLKCVKDQNGNHVVQKAIERIPAEHIQFVINAFTGQVHGLATHPYGCRVIQRMLEHCQEPARALLLEELHSCASNLIVDQYGNYVTQHVIEHGRAEDRAKIISLITAQLIHFSKHKFASNVVEKSIQFGTDDQRQTIVRILTAVDDKGESPLQQLMRDQYGNYVIQKLLAQLKGSEHEAFIEQIKAQLQQAKRFSYGKQVGAIEKLVNCNPNAFQHSHRNPPSPSRLDTSTTPTPPLLTEDTQSPQTSSLPSTNTSTVDGPIGDRKPTASIAVEIAPTSSTHV